jgi:hypothetical protein
MGGKRVWVLAMLGSTNGRLFADYGETTGIRVTK